jgi:hypothetical protein
MMILIKFITNLRSNTQNDLNGLSNNNNKDDDEETNDYLAQLSEELSVNIRRSTRPRTKRNRVYSLGQFEDSSNITNKKGEG